jgi:shikimate kinase
MPASGKSTLGIALAQTLQYRFLDLDSLIVKLEGRSIAEVFAEAGEAYFRQSEQKALHVALRATNTVIATGGGTPCFFDNMDLIRQKSLSIYLKTDLAILAKRIFQDSKNARPLYLSDSPEDLLQKLATTLAARQVFYEQAQIHWLLQT